MFRGKVQDKNGRRFETVKGLGVYEETASLKKILMWGAPGSEAVLGQLLPTEISCFQTQFDVLKARFEFESAKNLLEKEGVEVIQVKDLLAQMIEDKGLDTSKDLSTLTRELESKGNGYCTQHKEPRSKDVPVSEWLKVVLKEDAEKYGEKTAVIINQMLSGGSTLPMSNVIYARDQSNLLQKTWIWSFMKHDIRQPEVKLYRRVLEHAGIISRGIDIVPVDGGGKFEGGDGIVYDGKVYIGVGGRTNMKGIMQIAPYILGQGGRLLVPIDTQRAAGELGEMDAMHLDTYWMPCGQKQVVACDNEVCRRELVEIIWSGMDLKIEKRGWFADHLSESGIEIVPLTKQEQECYAPNFLNLGDDRIILSLSEGNNLTSELTKRGKKVYSANLTQITKGFGGLHCMTAAIKRG